MSAQARAAACSGERADKTPCPQVSGCGAATLDCKEGAQSRCWLTPPPPSPAAGRQQRGRMSRRSAEHEAPSLVARSQPAPPALERAARAAQCDRTGAGAQVVKRASDGACGQRWHQSLERWPSARSQLLVCIDQPIVGAPAGPRRVCAQHRTALQLNIGGEISRFCQKCRRLHPVDLFEARPAHCRTDLRHVAWCYGVAVWPASWRQEQACARAQDAHRNTSMPQHQRHATCHCNASARGVDVGGAGFRR